MEQKGLGLIDFGSNFAPEFCSIEIPHVLYLVDEDKSFLCPHNFSNWTRVEKFAIRIRNELVNGLDFCGKHLWEWCNF